MKKSGLLSKIFIVILLALAVALGVKKFAGRIGPENAELFKTYDGRPPLNVVWIGIDNLRPDALGCYNSMDSADTPAIDALAKKGVIFDRFFHQTPMLVPNVVSLMTGLPPSSHGVLNNSDFQLQPSHATLAERLKAKGYRTLGFVGATEYHRGSGLERGFDVYDDNLIELSGIQRANYILRAFSKVLNEKIFHELDMRPVGKSSPFFLWVQYGDLSHPYTVVKSAGKKTLDDPYHVRVKELDENIGALLKRLKKDGLLDNTLIVVAGAKPEYFGEHKITIPGTSLYNTHLNVPLIISGSRLFNRPAWVNSLYTGADVLPTLFDLMKWPKQEGLEGQSASTEIFEGPQVSSAARHIVVQSMMPAETYGVSPKYGILTPDWKWISNSPESEELYDLKIDSFELNEIHAKKTEIAAGFHKELEDYLKKTSFKPAEDAYRHRKLAEAGSKFKALFEELSGRPYEAKSWVSYLETRDEHALSEGERTTRNALKAADLRKASDAMVVLDRWLQHNSDDYTHSLLYSQIAMGDPSHSAEAFSRAWNAVELNPSALAAYAWLSQSYFKAGDADKGKKTWELAFLAAPEHSPAKIFAGIEFATQKDFAAVEKLGKELEAVSAEDASSYWAILSEKVENDKEIGKAADYMTRAVTTNPKNTAALKRRAAFNITQDKWEQGFPDLRKFIELDPDMGRASLLQLITFYGSRLRKLDTAREFAKTFEPELKGTVYKDLVEAYFFAMQNKNLEAIKLLEKSLHKKTSQNQRYALLNNLGNLHMTMGNRDKAREYYQMLLDEEPYEAASANNLARLLSDDRSNMPMAQQWIQKSLSLDSASSRYLDTLAKIYYLNNQPYYAAKVQKEAVINATQFTKPRYKVHLKDYVKASQKTKDNSSS